MASSYDLTTDLIRIKLIYKYKVVLDLKCWLKKRVELFCNTQLII